MQARLDDYNVLGVIGIGSFGTCYKVQKKGTDDIYVWKAIDYGKMTKEKKMLLVSEVNLLSELHHSNIVRYYDRIIHKATSTLYIVTEWCEGGDLASVINMCKRDGTHLDEAFVWKVLYQTARALQACHSYLARGTVMHRDVKPANVFLDSLGNVKLGDFGLARVLGNDGDDCANTVVGTPYYMSPEMVHGGKYNKKSDIWSLGCLVYETCALAPPFNGTSLPQLAQHIEEGKFPRIPKHYSDNLQKIITFMLNVNHSIRPTVEVILHHPTVVSHIAREKLKTKMDVPAGSIAAMDPGSHPGSWEDIAGTTAPELVAPPGYYTGKLETLRQREAVVRAKELAVIERERAIEKKEKDMSLISRAIKERLARANVYLRQCQSATGSNRSLQPLATMNTNADSSFSADASDTSTRPTSAKLHPGLVEKPVLFAKQAPVRHVHFDTLPRARKVPAGVPQHNSSCTWHRCPSKKPPCEGARDDTRENGQSASAHHQRGPGGEQCQQRQVEDKENVRVSNAGDANVKRKHEVPVYDVITKKVSTLMLR